MAYFRPFGGNFALFFPYFALEGRIGPDLAVLYVNGATQKPCQLGDPPPPSTGYPQEIHRQSPSYPQTYPLTRVIHRICTRWESRA